MEFARVVTFRLLRWMVSRCETTGSQRERNYLVISSIDFKQYHFTAFESDGCR